MDQQKRFILALALCGAILFGWQYLFPPPTPGGSTQGDAQTTAQKEGGDASSSTTSGAPSTDQKEEKTAGDGDTPESPGDDAPATTADIEPREDVLATPHLRMRMSNVGARMVGLEIVEPAQYEDAGKDGDLLGTFPDDSKSFPLGMEFDGDIALPESVTYELVEDESVRASGKQKGQGYEKLVYRYVDPSRTYQIDKVYRADPKLEYVVDLDVEVTNLTTKKSLDGKLALHLTGYKDPNKEESFFNMRPDELEGICRLTDDTERVTIGDLEEPEIFGTEQRVQWTAVGTRYFMWAAVPEEAATKCQVEKFDTNYVRAAMWLPEFDLDPGDREKYAHKLYLGPKETDRLEAVGHKLEESIDYGFWAWLAWPLHIALVFLQGFIGNWGLTIIVMTLILKLLTWPIMKKSYTNAERMKQIQPKLQEVREKYENDQQRLGEETFKVFRENDVSPFGCAPMLIQLPILYAFWVMIYNSVELYQADFALWYTDLSSPDPYYVLPILMGVAMFGQQLMTPMADDSNPQMSQMRTVMKIMPVVFTGMMLFLPSGLVLYYFVSLLLGLLQQFLIKRKFRTDDEDDKPEVAETV